MTIAVCYVCAEGVVLGADSTTTWSGAVGGNHYFNNNQKLFEVGAGGSVGIATWGLAGFGQRLSIRTVVAEFADKLEAVPQPTIADVASAWEAHLWPVYRDYLDNSAELQFYRDIKAKGQFVAGAPGAILAPNMRSEKEEQAFQLVHNNLTIGFYVAGRGSSSRSPGALVVEFDANMAAPPGPGALASGVLSWSGVPNIASRVVRGYDHILRNELLNSPHWTGSAADLDQILNRQNLAPAGTLPIRDAVDYVYSCIFGTIKAMKFSQLPPICGGVIEVAVLTSDREFRWVKHKSWSAGIDEVME